MNLRIQLLTVVIFFAAGIAAVLGGRNTSHRERFVLRDRPEISGEREGKEAENDWFMVQRIFPRNDLPKNAASAVRSGMKSLSRSTASVQTSDWTLAGPSNVGGRVTAVVLDPDDVDVVYAAAASGGVWKSNDLGTTWFNIFNESFSVGALAMDPLNSNVIYVGTGEANPSSVDTYPGNGIWRSSDAGSTWTNLGLGQVGQIGRIAVNPLNPNTIFVAALGLYRSQTPDRGIYRSTDRGASWTKVLFVDDTTGAADIVIDPSDTSNVIAATWTYYRTLAYVFRGGPGSALYRSTNGGSAWSKVTAGVPHDDPNYGRFSLAFAPSNPAIVYALASNGGGYNWGGVYRSTDHGATWSLKYAGSSGETQVWYNNIITVDPFDPGKVWAGMTTLYLSTDSAKTFSAAPISGMYHVDHHALVYSPIFPNTLVLGNDGGIYISTDNGGNWMKSLNLPITQYYAGAVSNLNPHRLLGGTQDNGSSETSNGEDPWSFFWGGDGFYCLIDPTDSNYVYAETQNGGIVYSTNGGGSFNGGTSGLDFSEWNGWETPIAFDPSHPKTLYTGFESVFRTRNNMQSWTKISPNLTYQISSGYSTVSTISVSPVDSNVIYAGTGDGRVWVTTNGGGLWTDVSAGLPLHWVSRVVTDPADAATAYVTLSGFREYDSAAHVYRTTDDGASWTSIGGSLPDIPVNDLVVDPANRSHLYIATDLNVMATTDGGATWNVLGSSLPEVTVHQLAFHAPTRQLAAFTHGRSVYTIRIPDANFATATIELNARWNLVSLPLRSQIDSAHYLFPMSGGPAFSYQPGSGYLASPVIVPGTGYWIQLPSGPAQAEISGYLIPAETLAVTAGWNLIGSISSPLPVGAVGTIGTTIISSVFGYSNGYVVTDTILPGGGYWLNMSQAGGIILQSGSRNPRPLPVVGVRELLAKYGTLTIRDAGGNSQTLYVGRASAGMTEASCLLPPVPAPGIFDARFATQSALLLEEDHPGASVPIRVRAGSYPLRIEWHAAGGTDARLTANGTETPMKEHGSITVPREGEQISVRFGPSGNTPTAFALAQNYPNPFNPSTQIGYSLPADARVRLTVYSTTGQLICTLADGVQAAGEKRVVWNGTAASGIPVSSGVYLCRIEIQPLGNPAGAVTFMKKMVCIR